MRSLITLFLCLVMIGIAQADDLTLSVEQSLAALGYDVGPVDGVETMETVIAISKYEAENQMTVTGEVSQELASSLVAKSANPTVAAAPGSAAAAPNSAAEEQAALQAAQQACLQRKIEKAQEKQQKKRGFGRLASAAARVAGRQGNTEVTQAAYDVYNANATIDDLSAAARDLGLTEDQIAKCENPKPKT